MNHFTLLQKNEQKFGSKIRTRLKSGSLLLKSSMQNGFVISNDASTKFIPIYQGSA